MRGGREAPYRFPVWIAVDRRTASAGNTFRAIPARTPYRPPRVTPKPRIPGLITGTIDPGPHGEPTYAQIDEQGRYLVRFLFDTEAHPGQAPSRPVRMVQPHAGERYGMHFPLKPGT